MRTRILSFCLLSLFFSQLSYAQKGKDGARTITGANTVVNTYTTITAAAAAGNTTMNVTSAAGLAKGDLVMVYQAQGATISSDNEASYGGILDYKSSGRYEFREVLSVAGNTITFTCALENAYDYQVTTPAGTPFAQRTAYAGAQVVKVPRYTNLTINGGASLTAPAWNGKSGGIVVVEASGNIIVNGTVDVTGKGFRGGQDEQITEDPNKGGNIYRTDNERNGSAKGEGIAGYGKEKVYVIPVYNDIPMIPGGVATYGNCTVTPYAGSTYISAVNMQKWVQNYGGWTTAQIQANAAACNEIPKELWSQISAATPPPPTTTDYLYYAYGEYGSGAPANGGGAGVSHNAGGGGGANAGLGTWNGNGIPDPNASYAPAWARDGGAFVPIYSGGGRGGYSFSQFDQDPLTMGPNDSRWGQDYRQNKGGLGGHPLDYSGGRIFMGGGGGSGDANNGCNTQASSGGGIVYFIADGNISGTGAVNANGADVQPNANPSCTIGNDASSGAGAGGAIMLKAMGAISGITANAKGGKGGDQKINATGSFLYEAEGPGGGGGGGYIATTPSTITTNVTGGLNGVTDAKGQIGAKFPPNGATRGGTGLIDLLTTWNVVADSATICNTASATLTASTIGTGAPVNPTYKWYATSATGVKGALLFTGNPYTPISGASLGVGKHKFIVEVDCPEVKDDTVSVTVIGCGPTVVVPPDTICITETATLTATGSGGTAPYTFSWNNSLGTGATKTVSPAVTTTYTVTITDFALLTSTATVTVVVNPKPVITATGGTVCAGSSTDLMATGAGTGGTYTWNNGVGTGTPKSVSPAANTIYTVTGTDMNGCVNTDTALVRVCGPMVVVIGDTLCAGESALLTAVGSAGTQPYTFTWSNGLGSGISKTVSPANTTTYTVTITDNAGLTASTTVTVIVNPNPIVTATGGPVCSGSSRDISASGAGAGTYAWDNSLGNGSTKSVSPAATTTYTVIGTDINGCKDTASAVVTVSPVPVINPASPSICSGGSVTLTANGADTYSWAPSTALSSTSGESVIASPTATITYTVLGTTTAGCTNTATVTVTVNPGPVVAVSGPVEICIGESTTLTGSLATSYTWSPATGLSATTGEFVTASPSVTTTYTVTGTTSGCPGNPEKTVIVTVNQLPVVDVVKDTALCIGESVELSTNSGYTTYAWSPAAGITAGAGTAKITVKPVATTLYKVLVTDSKGCKNKDSATVVIKPLPVVMATTVDICSNTPTNIALSSDISSGVTYSWTGTGNGAGSGTANPIAETLTNTTLASATTTYTIAATANGCTGPARPVSFKVKPIPVVSGSHLPICSGATTILNLSHNITTPNAVASYSWTAVGSAPTIGGYSTTAKTANPIQETLTNTGTSDGTVTYSVTPTVDGCTGSTTPILVTVMPIPDFTITNTAPVICGGNPTDITLTPTVTGTTFTWIMTQTSGTGIVNGKAIGTSTGDITEILTNTSNAPGTVTYTIKTANGCPGATHTTTVLVNPAPDALADDQIICSGDPLNIPVKSSTTGITVDYQWSSSLKSGTVTGQNATGSGSPITESLTNPGTTNGVLTYTITPSANGCTGGVKTVTVTVKPIPAAAITSDKDSLCSGSGVNLAATSPTTGTTFLWVANAASGITGASGGTNAGLSQTLSSTVAGVVRYTVTPTANLCPGPPVSKDIKVNPVPVSNAGTDGGFCIGDSLSIGAPAVANYAYVWTPATGLNNPAIANPVSEAIVTTTYKVTTTLNGCISSDEVVVSVSPKFTVNAGPDVIICAGDPVDLTASSTGAGSYLWNNGSTATSITVTPMETTDYHVTGNNGGCTAVDTVVIFIKNIVVPTLYIPNSFTPNNDDSNDIFKAYGEGIIEMEAMIFDRWGELIYSWDKLTDGWNGEVKNGSEIALNDVFVYKIKVKNECKKGFEEPVTGIVTVVK